MAYKKKRWKLKGCKKRVRLEKVRAGKKALLRVPPELRRNSSLLLKSDARTGGDGVLVLHNFGTVQPL